MKTTKYFIITLLSIIGLNACDNDSEKIIYNSQNAKSATLSSISDKLTLTVANMDKVAATFKWTQSNYGVNAAIMYTLQADVKGKNFANPIVIGTVSIDRNKEEMTWESKTSDLNKSLNKSASEYDLNISKPIDFEFRLVSQFAKSEILYSNVITSTIQLYQTSIRLPGTMYIIGSPFNWSWDKALALTPVWGFAGAEATPDSDKSMFWMIRYFNAGDAIKFNFNKAWDGGEFGYSTASDVAKTFAGLTDDGGDIKIGKAGWYIVVVTTNRSADGSSYVHTVDFLAPDVYVIGNTVGTWDVPNNFKFNVPGEGSGEFVSPAFAAADELRMCIKLKDIDWWKTEFIILNGKIEYRGKDGDQTRVKVAAGQKAYLKFSDGTGNIK